MERTEKDKLGLFNFTIDTHHLKTLAAGSDFDAVAWKLLEDYVDDTGDKAIAALSNIHDKGMKSDTLLHDELSVTNPAVEAMASEGNWTECFDTCQAVIDEQLEEALTAFKESPEYSHSLPNYSDRIVYGPKVLVVQQEGQEDIVVPLKQGIVTIGRSENADVMINSTALSRLHCIVHVTDDGKHGSVR